MKTNISISKISYAVTISVLLLFTGCRKEKGEPVHTFECIANERFALTGANYWYDEMNASVQTNKDGKNYFKFKVPCIFVKKTTESQATVDDDLTKAFQEYPIESIAFSVETNSQDWTKGTKKIFTYGAANTEIYIYLTGPNFYSVKIKSGSIRCRFLSNASSKPHFYASFEFDLDVEVKADSDGETIDTFPLHLTNGVMSYKPMQ